MASAASSSWSIGPSASAPNEETAPDEETAPAGSSQAAGAQAVPSGAVGGISRGEASPEASVPAARCGPHQQMLQFIRPLFTACLHDHAASTPLTLRQAAAKGVCTVWLRCQKLPRQSATPSIRSLDKEQAKQLPVRSLLASSKSAKPDTHLSARSPHSSSSPYHSSSSGSSSSSPGQEHRRSSVDDSPVAHWLTEGSPEQASPSPSRCHLSLHGRSQQTHAAMNMISS